MFFDEALDFWRELWARAKRQGWRQAIAAVPRSDDALSAVPIFTGPVLMTVWLVRACRFKRCVRCHLARYCSKECQAADWEMHKAYCAPSAVNVS
eukprot:gene22460-29414_t